MRPACRTERRGSRSHAIYGFRPGRRAQDAIAEIHHLISRPAGYGWVVEGDITACFDEIDHPALLQRVRRRITDKRVLALIKAFCKGGILTQDGATQDTITGTPKEASSPRCWPTSPLSVLDEHFTAAWEGFGPPWTRKKLPQVEGAVLPEAHPTPVALRCLAATSLYKICSSSSGSGYN